MSPQRAIFGLCVLWFCAISLGSGALWRYKNTPGPQSDAPHIWPKQSKLKPNVLRPTLLMFAHPRCPCTRASVAELALLMTDCQGRVDARVVFFQPERQPWAGEQLVEAAAAIPGVSVVADAAGTEARIFNGATSGYSVLYDEQGRLLFSGGITKARGHAGDNAGRDALTALIQGRIPIQTHTSVYGCLIHDR